VRDAGPGSAGGAGAANLPLGRQGRTRPLHDDAATRERSKAHPVTLYVAPDCGKPCTEGRTYLDGRGIPHKVIDINSEGGGAEAQRIAKTRAVPVLTVGREKIDGFEAAAWKEALDAAGYPSWAPKPAASAPAGGPAAAVPKQPVILYTAPNCAAPCERARELLAARGVPYEEINVDTDEKAEELEKLSGGNTVPTMVVGGTVRRGFEATQYNTTLDAGGYARR
jgi:glutaredoxin